MAKNLLKTIGLTAGLLLAESFYIPLDSTAENNKGKFEYNPIKIAEEAKEIARRKRDALFDQEALKDNSDKIKQPYFRLNPSHCSKYARLSAKKLFKKEYIAEDAWNLKYANKTIYDFKENETLNDSTTYETLKDLIIKGTLEPGMIVGAKLDIPAKLYKKYGNRGFDKKRNKIDYTHVMLYIGLNKEKQPEFIQHWGRKIEKITLEDFKDRKNMKLTQILDSPDKTQ